MVETLDASRRERLSDLMWEPVERARALAVVEAVQPDAIIVDHLAFSARLALGAAASRFADVVLGHPSALPVGGRGLRVSASLAGAFSPEDAGAR